MPHPWNAATGNSAGFQDWNVDLSSFAGKNVEVSITYASDPGVSTDHSLYRGFGLEGVPGRATGAQLMGDAMRYFRVH